MAIASTFIAPGRRYVLVPGRSGQLDGRITITHVGRDARGIERVTYRSPLRFPESARRHLASG